MEEDDSKNELRDWMERRAASRKVLAALDWVHEAWHGHLHRYYYYEATAYRVGSWLVATTVVLVLLALVAGTLRVGAHFYRHKLEMRAQKEAQEFFAQGDFGSASLSARRALTYNQNNVAACRVMAELGDRVHAPATLDWLRRMAQIEPTRENQLILAAAGLNYQAPPFPLTLQILKELAPTATNSASYQAVAGSLAMHQCHLAEAEGHYEAAARLEPKSEIFRASVAILRMALTNQAEQAQSRAILKQLQTDESLGLLVLRALVADRLLHKDVAGAKTYTSQLVANRNATLEDQLQHLEILGKLKNDDFNLWLQNMQQQVTTNALAVAEMSAWMQGNGLVAQNLDWLSGLPVKLLDQQPVQMAQAQGYLHCGNWPALREIASQSNWGRLEFLRQALLFRAWSQLGEAGVADNCWNAALGEAAGNHEAMTQLWELAERWQLKGEREHLLLQVIEEFPNEHGARQELEALDYNTGNTTGLHELYALLHQQFPAETNYNNDATATALLLKIDLHDACQSAAEAYARDPGNAAEASTYAFALHMQGRDKQGLAVLQAISPAELARPSMALYYGVLLAAAGKAGEAGHWLQIAQTQGHLLPEEQQLLTLALELDGVQAP